MKIMILVPSFGKGSPIEGAFLFAKYLHENGLDVLFVSLDRNYNSNNSILCLIKKAGLNYKCLNIKGHLGLLFNNKRFYSYAKEEGVDVALSFLLRPTLLVSSLSNTLKIASVRGILREDYPTSYAKIPAMLYLQMEMRALKKMDHVFSLTDPMKEWLISEGVDGHNISTVNNCVDVKLISSEARTAEFHGNGKINIGMFGSLIPRKRIDVALDALRILVHEYKHVDIRLHIAGFGPLRAQIEKMACSLNIRNQVTFCGFLTNPLELMQKMNLVLLTSESEGTPRTLMEALSLGKTCVASDIKGVKKLILDEQTGYLFPVPDAERLAATVDSIVKNEAYLPPDRLISFMLKNFDVDVVCKEMLYQIEKISMARKAESLVC